MVTEVGIETVPHLVSIQEDIAKKKLFFPKFCEQYLANWIIVDIVQDLMLQLVATHFYFYFLSLKYGVRRA